MSTLHDAMASIRSKLADNGMPDWAEGDDGKADRDRIKDPARWSGLIDGLESLGVELSYERGLLDEWHGARGAGPAPSPSRGPEDLHPDQRPPKAAVAALRAEAMRLILAAAKAGGPESHQMLRSIGWRWIKVKSGTNGYREALRKLQRAGAGRLIEAEAILARLHK